MCMCTARLQECLWYVWAQLYHGLGLSLGTQVYASVGLSMADSKHPACMPTWACVTPLRVRVPAVSGCICQGLHGRTCRREAQFWNI